jgi:S1-C subfamily serine protease
MLELSSIGRVRPGQEVIAIGSALGVLQNTVTRGIVSALRNDGGVMLLQTDAAINPGNSGGPLLDRSGRVVGVNSMKVGGAAASIGFAVAADHVRTLVDSPSGTSATRPARPDPHSSRRRRGRPVTTRTRRPSRRTRSR